MGANQSRTIRAMTRTSIWRPATRLPRAAVYCTAAGIGTAALSANQPNANAASTTPATATATATTTPVAVGCRRCNCCASTNTSIATATKRTPATNDPFTYFASADSPPADSVTPTSTASGGSVSGGSGSGGSGGEILSVREQREGRTGELLLPRDAITVEAENARCEAMKLRIIESSPRVQYMLRALSTSGCPVDEHFLRCNSCPQLATGHFSRDSDGYCFIQLCSNFNLPDSTVEASITHELIHAFDYCRIKDLDHTNCAHVACTEVRASALSGECSMQREWNRGRYGWTNHHRECVRQRATLSVSMNPNCQNPAAAVDAVLDTCLADKEPFGTIP